MVRGARCRDVLSRLASQVPSTCPGATALEMSSRLAPATTSGGAGGSAGGLHSRLSSVASTTFPTGQPCGAGMRFFGAPALSRLLRLQSGPSAASPWRGSRAFGASRLAPGHSVRRAAAASAPLRCIQAGVLPTAATRRLETRCFAATAVPPGEDAAATAGAGPPPPPLAQGVVVSPFLTSFRLRVSHRVLHSRPRTLHAQDPMRHPTPLSSTPQTITRRERINDPPRLFRL